MEEGRGEGEMEGSHTDGALETLVYLFPRSSLIFPSSQSPNISHLIPSSQKRVSTSLCVGWAGWLVVGGRACSGCAEIPRGRC